MEEQQAIAAAQEEALRLQPPASLVRAPRPWRREDMKLWRMQQLEQDISEDLRWRDYAATRSFKAKDGDVAGLGGCCVLCGARQRRVCKRESCW